MSLITEEQVELQSIEWFKELGYQYKDGYEIAPERLNAERNDLDKLFLKKDLDLHLLKQILIFLIKLFKLNTSNIKS